MERERKIKEWDQEMCMGIQISTLFYLSSGNMLQLYCLYSSREDLVNVQNAIQLYQLRFLPVGLLGQIDISRVPLPTPALETKRVWHVSGAHGRGRRPIPLCRGGWCVAAAARAARRLVHLSQRESQSQRNISSGYVFRQIQATYHTHKIRKDPPSPICSDILEMQS